MIILDSKSCYDLFYRRFKHQLGLDDLSRATEIMFNITLWEQECDCDKCFGKRGRASSTS